MNPPDQTRRAHAVVTPELADAFARDGAVCLRGLLNADEVALLRAGIDANIAAPSPRAKVASRPDDPGFFIEDFCCWQDNDAYRRVIFDSPWALIRGLLMKSDMLTAISPHQLQHELTSGALVELAVRLDASSRKIGITTRERAMPSPAARAVLAEIRRASRTTPRPPGRSAAR